MCIYIHNQTAISVGALVTLSGRIFTDNFENLEEENYISRWVMAWMWHACGSYLKQMLVGFL